MEKPAENSMIVAQRLTKVYNADSGQVTALDGVDLAIQPGEFAAIMGPSGCGKSTLLNLIAGLDSPESGSLVVDGMQLTGMSESRLTNYRRTRVGVVFQFFNLLPTLTVAENISLPALLAGVTEKKALEKAAQLCDRTGIAHRMHHRPHQLSGGEMQRAAIARALINEPAVVLADEPTGNLDSHSASHLLEILRTLADDHQVTIVMVTHAQEAATVADRIVRMVDGRIVDYGIA